MGGKKKAVEGHVETGDQKRPFAISLFVKLKLVIVGGVVIRDIRKLILSFTG
jgi:hypothetical protein